MHQAIEEYVWRTVWHCVLSYAAVFSTCTCLSGSCFCTKGTRVLEHFT